MITGNLQPSNGINRNMIFNKFPELETKNLVLRAINIFDIFQIHKLHLDEDIQREFEFEKPTSFNYQEILKNILNGFELKKCISWGMILKEENILIGMRICYFDHDTDPVVFEGMVLEDYRCKGYTTEAYTAIIKFLRQANVKSIKARTKSHNKPAISMLEKFGFINIGTSNTFRRSGNTIYSFEKDLTHENSLLLSDELIEDNLDSEQYYILATIYYDENQYAIAKEYIDRAIILDENKSDYFYTRGLIILASFGRLKALPDFERAVQLNPNNVDAIIESGNIMYDLGSRFNARELWSKAADLGSKRAEKLLLNNP